MNTDFFDLNLQTPVTNVHFMLKDGSHVKFAVKRDDLIDPYISGNKWRKLKYNFLNIQQGKYKAIASFGGAYSNHIAALSAAGKRANISTLGFIRTHSLDSLNPTLSLAKQNGMELIALSRQEYRNRYQESFLTELQQTYPNHFFVPEGGSNHLANLGLEELANEINQQGEFNVISCAIGSGGTIRGLMRAMPDKKFVGIAVVNDERVLAELQNEFANRLTIVKNYMFGGYAKTNGIVNDFCLELFRQTNVPVEPVYTGKLFYAWCHDLQLREILQKSKTLLIHTGGLQGLKGLSCHHPSLLRLWQQLTPDSVV